MIPLQKQSPEGELLTLQLVQVGPLDEQCTGMAFHSRSHL